MPRRILSLVLFLSLMLSGCSAISGSYVSITPHQVQYKSPEIEVASASSYSQLRDVMEGIVSAGIESATIQVSDYPSQQVERGMLQACRYIREMFPMGAYNVSDIGYELGTHMGKPAIAVSIQYRHRQSEIQQIHNMEQSTDAESAIGLALATLDAGTVLTGKAGSIPDFTQVVQNYAYMNPQTVMEIPRVTESYYGTGSKRIVELNFAYQTDRDSLRRMQTKVKPVFDSAALYVSGEGSERQKFSQLYAFLMDRFDYKIETSITPAYSLLCHGVGDSRAFATVYAAMCRNAGLDCMVVTGTHLGEPFAWNIVLVDGYPYHVDLLRCSRQGNFQTFTDYEMRDYVWDYSAFPVCSGAQIPAVSEDTAATETGAVNTLGATEPSE